MKIPKSYKRVTRGVVREGDMLRYFGTMYTAKIQRAFLFIGREVSDAMINNYQVYRKPKRYMIVKDFDYCEEVFFYDVYDIRAKKNIYSDCTKHYAYKALKILNGES